MNHPSKPSEYVAHFYMQVEGPDLEDPVEAAAIARHEGAYNLRGVWVITAGDVEYVVDLTEGKVLSERPRDYVRNGPNGGTEIRRTATGPDGLPTEVWVRVGPIGNYYSSTGNHPEGKSEGAPRGAAGLSNSAARKQRLERCRRAVELQEHGLTRREIAEKLGVVPTVVKALIRDGKFYADPQSDPARLATAREARAARDRKVTREEFRESRGLTRLKSIESWRDAAVLDGEHMSEDTH